MEAGGMLLMYLENVIIVLDNEMAIMEAGSDEEKAEEFS